jgi:hypothetical protein
MIVPDFTSVVAESITLPYDPTKKFLLLRFTDPLLKDYSLIVILTWVAPLLGKESPP